MIAPAMDLDMYQHPSNLKNIETLKSYGNIIVEAATGELASGLSGKGRMEEPQYILDRVVEHFQSKKKLKNKKFLVTAGPTYEKIDPVRFIGNYSSGKMGYAIAEALAEHGAEVVLVTGPTSLSVKNDQIKIIHAHTAGEMFHEVTNVFPGMDGAILSAAVSDFKPKISHDKKIKRGKDNLSIDLEPTQDIAGELGKVKNSNQLLVGFALETDNEEENAISKLEKKNLDFIVLNSLKDSGAGFQVDTNKIKIIDRENKIDEFELKSKVDVAKDIVEKLIDMVK